ncbi:hypothetical protein N657DRAFT_692966 [Parathielavia appendiculata]|uniref:Hemerythrin-like domain-containing protein n=1 Tax=Parathielavia appendiculata TaxID=2587402 RepID=A0AAN6TTJ6_9PEZI|nr:hypothetical protein N657DRAFT_692966 [Parathielavia appendiculata]
MAPVYADHPFPVIPTPVFLAKSKNEEPDMFDELASEMVHVHNMMIRGLNSIYLQAPHIKSADEKGFCKYILLWHELLHGHHSGEEALFFPEVEKLTGVKGIMETNVEQHKAFHDGIGRFKAYAQSVIAGGQKYEGSKVVAMINEFGPALIQHLTDEIPTVLGLRQYGKDRLAGLPKVFDQEGEQAMKELGLAGMVFCFANLDMQYENAMWQSWPPAPPPVKVLCRSVFWWLNPDARKFGAVDRMGKMQPLYAVPESS